MTFEDILLEVSYKLPKGYPTVVDGVFTERDEVCIINECLLENGFNPLPMPEATTTISKPTTGTNDISLKEGLVCLFYDIFKDASLVADLSNLHTLVRDKQTFDAIKPQDVADIFDRISKVYAENSKFYGNGKSMPVNLDKYVKYVLSTRDELDTLTNAMSAAAAIHSQISSKGRIIRDNTFDNIRKRATQLIKQDYNLTLLADNWCPGDVYLVVDSSAVKTALSADTLSVGESSLNNCFEEGEGLIAISLKEEVAQAGKATTFAKTVFTNTFDAHLDPNLKYGSSANKAVAKVSAKISRFEDYYYGPKQGATGLKKRPQSYTNAISKDNKVHGSVNTILQAAGFPTIKTTNITPAKSDEEFLKNNKAIFSQILKAIKKLKGQMGGDEVIKKTQKQFVESRNKFLKDLASYDVEIQAEDSIKFAKEVMSNNSDSLKTLSMKTSAYELASLIIQRWTDKNAEISPAYKKIQEVSNPFVALTAFAIAEAGISPSFWKVIGSAKSLMGHADYFDASAVVDIDSKSSKIKLVDSPNQAGFYLQYTTLLGSKRYLTMLVFRFSGSEIRIEVQRLKKL